MRPPNPDSNRNRNRNRNPNPDPDPNPNPNPNPNLAEAEAELGLRHERLEGEVTQLEHLEGGWRGGGQPRRGDGQRGGRTREHMHVDRKVRA